ncbi:prepilin-type N-terminal cleavage/methylation domain-containing protein [Neobacillus sp. OS1-33]|uniref:prepilin-type N-terminal cleavage/methylation domain-containing protein n=1 Tax=Neobacillus sp. OS1-33 TaxID=3070683 RepID=UPI0027E137BF|nr:prepilin-type N-terminal cleavage/methylation domain-containing protein [Neobacillus sp. OS1-33]WML25422.1 prepilin-type N-terminal cleavage/methylation domain-containing protein [Neobacillus sp. OS1-33]
MKKNGFTLIELLVVLAIMGLVLGVIFSMFSSGIKQGEKMKNRIYLQQEANYVSTVLRKTHQNKPEYTIEITTSEIKIDGITISDKFNYVANIKYNKNPYINGQKINSSYPVEIEIKFSKDGNDYTLRTTLSRGV